MTKRTMAPPAWNTASLLGLFTLQLCCLGVHGWCMMTIPLTEMKDGVKHMYCEYKGVHYEIGSKFKIPKECTECSCSNNGMSCCGYGIAAGVFGAPSGCKVIAHGCTPYMVKLEDETKDCLTGGPLTPIGKK